MAGIAKRENTAFSDENLTGRTQKLYFSATEEENYTYYGNVDVDFNKRTSIDCTDLEARELNQKIRDAMNKGYGTVVIKNPGAKHSLGVGILNKLNVIFEGSLGYFGVGCIDGPTVRAVFEGKVQGVVVHAKMCRGSSFFSCLGSVSL